jgi:Dihydropteroate synthase and related enzymes
MCSFYFVPEHNKLYRIGTLNPPGYPVLATVLRDKIKGEHVSVETKKRLEKGKEGYNISEGHAESSRLYY